MWFKSLTIYTLVDSFEHDVETIDEKLNAARFREILPTESWIHGWVPPVGDQDDEEAPLVHSVHGYHVMCLMTETKILPPASLRKEVGKRIKAAEEKEQRKLGRRERARLKEETVYELLPRCLTKQEALYLYIDPERGRIVVDDSSWKKVEMALELLRGCLGTLPIRPLQVNDSPQAVMTRWLAEDAMPKEFEPGRELVLEDPRSDASNARFRNHDVLSSTIKAHLNEGMRVDQLQLVWDERIAMVLGADMQMTKVRFLDVVQEDSGDREPETEAERFDADMAIQTLEVDRLIGSLLSVFGGQATEDHRR